MDLNQVNERAKQINQALVSRLFKREILNNKEEIVTLVRERWLRGKKPDGSIIGEYRSFAYQQEKLRMNSLAGGNVDLTLTGALNKGLDIFPLSGDNFNIFSKDEKARSIAEKYGLDVYGLTKEEEEIVVDLTINRVNVALINFIQTGAL